MKSNITGRATVTINAPAEEVWKALTDPAMIKQYFFGTNSKTVWKAGSPVSFEGEYEGKTYKDKGTVQEVTPHKRIRYNYWSSMSGIEDKPENYVDITYELNESSKNQTTLNIVQENIRDEATKKHSEENWKKVLNSLKNLLEQNKVSSY